MFKVIGLVTTIFCLLLSLLVSGTPAFAQNKRVLIRDAETESTIRAYTKPLFETAGLVSTDVGIKLIMDNSLNAFVSGGQNIYIHTGLILSTNNVDEIIGVIAHETGHISGGHLARTSDAMNDAKTLGMMATVLGVGAGLLADRGDVVAAAAVSGSEFTKRSFLKFSRTQESSADHAALTFLEANGMSARGLYDFLHVLEDNDLLSSERQDPYQRSHPITRERIAVIENHMAQSQFTDIRPSNAMQLTYDRVRAKLYAYTHPFITTLRQYPKTDTSIAARYARAFAYYKKPNLEKALSIIDGLITEMPEDAYFHELKAEMLFDHGQVSQSIPYYELASNLAPNTALLLLELARAQVATEDPAMMARAVKNLKSSLYIEPKSSFAWNQLAIAYGRSDHMALSTLAMAEEAMLQGRFSDAVYQAGKAETMFEPGTKEHLQASDILNAAENAVSQPQ